MAKIKRAPDKRRRPFKSALRTHPEYWYTLFLPGYLLVFALVERLIPADGDYWISCIPLDDKIPFLEIFVIPYCMWYFLLLGVGLSLLRADAPQFCRYMRFLIFGFGFSMVVFLLFPNGQTLRPAEMPRDNICTRLLAFLYAVDTNTNVLPSMHVVGCGAAVCGVFHTKSPLRRWRWVILPLALLISVSTLFVKQHSILDLLAGIAVTLPLYRFIYRKKEKMPKSAPD
ncbi:MAG: phosphoesterase [Oscillospiraceae bacterium]|nr:phosphoesterase [Oscillospiraceae bacterium]